MNTSMRYARKGLGGDTCHGQRSAGVTLSALLSCYISSALMLLHAAVYRAPSCSCLLLCMLMLVCGGIYVGEAWE